MFEWIGGRSDVYPAAANGKTIARESTAPLKGLLLGGIYSSAQFRRYCSRRFLIHRPCSIAMAFPFAAAQLCLGLFAGAARPWACPYRAVSLEAVGM